MFVIAQYRDIMKKNKVQNAVFYPYFSQDKPVESQTAGVLCSVFKAGDHLLLLAANTGTKPREAGFAISRDFSKGPIRILDEINNKELSSSGNILRIKADPYDLLMISITASGTKK
jgi:hypothetical protein